MYDELTWSELLDMELRLERGGLTRAQQRRAVEFIRDVFDDEPEYEPDDEPDDEDEGEVDD